MNGQQQIDALEVEPTLYDGSAWLAGRGSDRGVIFRVPAKWATVDMLAVASASKLDASSVLGVHRPARLPTVEPIAADDEEPDERLRIGELLVQARFVRLVEMLHPGCVWRAPSRASLRPVEAWSDATRTAELVALVMPLAEDADHARAAAARGLTGDGVAEALAGEERPAP